MEKIAFKNNLQGGQNTYEIQYNRVRQLFGAMSRVNEISGGNQLQFYITSQPFGVGYNLPLNIRVLGITLYFSQGNGQTLNIKFANDNVDENFNAPIGAGFVYLPIGEIGWSNDITQRVILSNIDTPSAPEPRLVSWCLKYYFQEP